MQFTVKQEQRGRFLYDVVSAGGADDLNYVSMYRLTQWRTTLDYIERHRVADDPPAWDILFDLFPDDMMRLLQFKLLESARPDCKSPDDVTRILEGSAVGDTGGT